MCSRTRRAQAICIAVHRDCNCVGGFIKDDGSGRVGVAHAFGKQLTAQRLIRDLIANVLHAWTGNFDRCEYGRNDKPQDHCSSPPASMQPRLMAVAEDLRLRNRFERRAHWSLLWRPY